MFEVADRSVSRIYYVVGIKWKSIDIDFMFGNYQPFSILFVSN